MAVAKGMTRLAEQTPRVEQFHQDRFGAFYRAHGLTIEEARPGEVVVRLPHAADAQRGGGGTDALNGGVMAYMFDGALGAAVASAALHRLDGRDVDLSRFGQVTVTLNINYLRAARGDAFEARGVALQVGGSLGFAEGKLYDERGDLCASASGVWRIFLPDR